MAGKTRVSVKTKKLRGKAIVRGGAGTATRTVGLLGGILTYAVEAGIISSNPAHGIRKPKDNVRNRRLTEAEYRTLGEMLRAGRQGGEIRDDCRHHSSDRADRLPSQRNDRPEVDRGGHRGELPAAEDSKEGASIRPIGLPVVEFLEQRRDRRRRLIRFPRVRATTMPLAVSRTIGSNSSRIRRFPDVTPHVLRHSFASIANDLGFTEVTIAALVGHAKGSVTSKYIHTLDTALIMAADTISGYIQGLLDGSSSSRPPMLSIAIRGKRPCSLPERSRR